MEKSFVVDLIRTKMKEGRSLSDVCDAFLQGGFPEKDLEPARQELRSQIRKIGSMTTPCALSAGRLDWYPGPGAGDMFWPALEQYLLQTKQWPTPTIDSVDQSSTRVVSLLQPPTLGQIDTRGLVVGYVQSGKTANFTAVFAKAADAGYKLFIVLSGLHNALRRQTQERLDAELIALNGQHWFSFTNALQDFKPLPGKNTDAFLADIGHQKILCVVKKNKDVLARLLDWSLSKERSLKKVALGGLSNAW